MKRRGGAAARSEGGWTWLALSGRALTGLLVSVSLLPAAGWAEERGLAVRVRADGGNQGDRDVQLYRSSRALVIGVDKYREGWPQLKNAVKDAVEVAAELRKRGFVVRLVKDPDGNALRNELRTFFAAEGLDPEARQLLWFAGHGHTDTGEGFLVPVDAPRGDDPRFRLKALHMREFGSLMRLSRSKHVLAVFDACFAGTIFTARAGAPPAAITRRTTLPVRQFISAGDAEQTVSDDGSFRELFLQALRGERPSADPNADGYLTGVELGLFLSQELANVTQGAQTPLYGKLHDVELSRGDFVFEVADAPPPPDAERAGSGGLDIVSGKALPPVGGLRMEGTPQGARLDVTGPGGYERATRLPATLRRLAPGKYLVRASKEGFMPADAQVDVLPDTTVWQKFRLEQSGALKVSGWPTGATVGVIDDTGAEIAGGAIPITIRGLPPGAYRLQIRRAGYWPFDAAGTVRPGRTSEVKVRLKRESEKRLPKAPLARPPAERDADEAAAAQRPSTTWTWVVAGGSAAAGAAAGTLYFLADSTETQGESKENEALDRRSQPTGDVSKANELMSEAQDDYDRAAIYSTVGLALAGAAVVSGAWALLRAVDAGPDSALPVPMVTPAQGGIRAGLHVAF